MLNEDVRSVLVRQQLSQRHERNIRTTVEQLTGIPVSFENSLDSKQLEVIALWVQALHELKAYELSWRLLIEECNGIVFGLPKQTEDAQWRPESILFLATKDAGYETRHMLKSIVHELGHALEEKLRVNLDRSPYGRPPFANNYSYTNPVEDFAETFMLHRLDPLFLQRVAPNKFQDMSSRCRRLAKL